MKYAHLPTIRRQRLTFYLAMEEYLARTTRDEWFFMWQVAPTVIFGRNQLIENEVNLPFCRRKGIATYRRKSGGGCVYADMGNIMLSYVGNGKSVEESFRHMTSLTATALQSMGLDVEVSGRNDLMLQGKKVSGNAFYRIGERNIIHGTLLYDTNMENMVGSITPDNQKLLTKGIESVRQRVGLLKDALPFGIDELKKRLRACLTDHEATLSPEDYEAIRHIETTYLDRTFIYGSNPAYTLVKHSYKPGCGTFEAHIRLKNNIIQKINLLGDFFLIGDLDDSILNCLRGVPLEVNDIRNALISTDVSHTILHYTNDDLISLLTADG